MADRRVTRKVALRLRGDGTLRLAAVADTHSRPHPAAAGYLTRLRPAATLHAGDIGDLAVLDGLAATAPVHAVRGNIDTRTYGRQSNYAAGRGGGQTRRGGSGGSPSARPLPDSAGSLRILLPTSGHNW
jgi:hypothetical protein